VLINFYSADRTYLGDCYMPNVPHAGEFVFIKGHSYEVKIVEWWVPDYVDVIFYPEVS